jgi:hypothetical protein
VGLIVLELLAVQMGLVGQMGLLLLQGRHIQQDPVGQTVLVDQLNHVSY